VKKIIILYFVLFFASLSYAQIKISAPGVKWENYYSFDMSNEFKVDFYAKNNELMRSMHYKTHYQSNGENFLIRLVDDGRGNYFKTIMDKKNEVAVQIIGSVGGPAPFYNASAYKYPDQKDQKRLELTPTTETKQILGFNCIKYTYTYKKISGEAWITEQISLSNDVGIFRSAKMSALHNTLSVGGFVLEMTSVDASGAKTIMKTVSIKNSERYSEDLKGVEMNTSINKPNYFSY
jgi:hypothetical protein